MKNTSRLAQQLALGMGLMPEYQKFNPAYNKETLELRDRREEVQITLNRKARRAQQKQSKGKGAPRAKVLTKQQLIDKAIKQHGDLIKKLKAQGRPKIGSPKAAEPAEELPNNWDNDGLQNDKNQKYDISDYERFRRYTINLLTDVNDPKYSNDCLMELEEKLINASNEELNRVVKIFGGKEGIRDFYLFYKARPKMLKGKKNSKYYERLNKNKATKERVMNRKKMDELLKFFNLDCGGNK